ncbi:hypothetical protein [Anabaena sp. CCY 0017]|uniref:hypothetical protein n=1 Tax=Anabaena sp. CCY 0017 TaxID=3103866 RepID=UPI0039C66558
MVINCNPIAQNAALIAERVGTPIPQENLVFFLEVAKGTPKNKLPKNCRVGIAQGVWLR